MKNKKDIFLILDNIRSSENVGSIFRTADAAGVSKIYLCGYTPAPTDRFGRENKKLTKASLGAEKFVSWEKIQDIFLLIKNLQEEKVSCVAVEQHKNSKNYKKFSLPAKTAFILGNEVEGVAEKVCRVCNAIVEIPMYGKKESLNVSVAAGIILFNT